METTHTARAVHACEHETLRVYLWSTCQDCGHAMAPILVPCTPETSAALETILAVAGGQPPPAPQERAPAHANDMTALPPGAVVKF